jgi:hypothetical protein
MGSRAGRRITKKATRPWLSRVRPARKIATASDNHRRLSEEKDLTHNDEFEQTMKLDVEARVRERVKAVLEKVLEEEMT